MDHFQNETFYNDVKFCHYCGENSVRLDPSEMLFANNSLAELPKSMMNTFRSDAFFSDAAFYTLVAFLITELSVILPALFFDFMGPFLKQYKTRKALPNEEMISTAKYERLSKYKTDWLVYLITWYLSNMDFSLTPPSWTISIIYALVLSWALDFWIYLIHWWMHVDRRFFIHKKHHTAQIVDCWLVDHEEGWESLLLGFGKHMILVVFCAHPRVAFTYLFYTKFWNVIGHCGYNLPIFQFMETYLPFLATPNQHELHHYYHKDLNFSVFLSIPDWIMGTLAVTELDAQRFRRK